MSKTPEPSDDEFSFKILFEQPHGTPTRDKRVSTKRRNRSARRTLKKLPSFSDWSRSLIEPMSKKKSKGGKSKKMNKLNAKSNKKKNKTLNKTLNKKSNKQSKK